MTMKEYPTTNCKPAALKYLKKGYSVIPIKPNKKPFIQWEEFQKRQPTQDEVHEWWRKWPSANVAIVTGKISGICGIDVDEKIGFEAIEEYIPDNLEIPTCKTPKEGHHLHFQMPEQPIGNNTRTIPGCDFRGEGGYLIVPPSKGYKWLDSLNLSDAEPPPLPMQVLNKYLYALTYKENGRKIVEKNLPERNITFDEPGRDETLFHLAHHLVKGGMPLASIEKYLTFFASNCNPPFPKNEKEAKIKSALERGQRQERNLSQELRELIFSTNGLLFTTDIYKILLISTIQGQKLVWKVLNKMTEEGILEKVKDRVGCYRRIEKECEDINFLNASTHTVEISLPFEIEKKVKIMPGNIIVIAGEINAGKTAFLLNVVKDNMAYFDICYFSSEMGDAEMRERLSKFDIPLNAWNFKPKERSDNFGDVIVGGEGRINIIDYLELYDNFYLVSKHIAEIYKKLNGAIAIVALQKNPGTNVGVGGFRSLEKPRLYLAMSKGKLRIVKAKNWKDRINPNGQEINFTLADGCKFKSKDGWHLTELGDSV